MKRTYFVSLFLCLTTSLLSQSNPVSLINQTARVASPISASQPDPQAQARILDGYGKLPLSFEANQGQSDPQVKYLARGTGYSLFLTSNEAVLTFQPSIPSPARSGQAKEGHQPPVSRQPSAGAVLRMKLLNANPKTEVSGQDELPGKSNYFIGNDPTKWHTNVRQFSKVRYENVYPGVDLVYYGHQRELEYDFVLQPGAKPEAIRLGIAGAKRLRLEHGDLVLTGAGGDVHLRSPNVYQEANGVRREVHGGYVIKSKNEVGFEVAAYDRRRALVIDPVLAYSTYLGGSFFDYGYAIAVDTAGNAYVTGSTTSADFPTVNAIQPTLRGYGDAFVTKINADGTALVYSTYLGGSDYDTGSGIAVDTAGNAYITGGTVSTDFPTVNAIQSAYHGGNGDAFVTKINADGAALVYSTYLGGSSDDYPTSIAIDGAGNAYVTGYTYSTDFPTASAIQPANHGKNDVFVTKINADGSRLVYSTYLGGSNWEYSDVIAADTSGNAYVIGTTSSTDFPTANALQATNHGGFDAFVTKINADGSRLVYSTYLGGSGGENCGVNCGQNYRSGGGIAVDAAGSAYVTGTTSSTDFPIANALQVAFHGWFDAFVTKINADGSDLVYSTYLGGSGDDDARGIAVDAAGNAYVTGDTDSTDFPTADAIQTTNHGGHDAFVSAINAAGNAFLYSTYLGGEKDDSAAGIAVDSSGTVYVTGQTASRHFPKTLLALQQSFKGLRLIDTGFVAKIASQTFVNVSPAKLVFPVLALGTTSVQKKLTLMNQGSGTLTINNVFIGGLNPGDFGETNTCGGTLAPNASCTISVRFTPTDKKLRKALLGISDSDPASPQAVALSGTGTFVSLSAKSLTFGKLPVGTTSSPKTVTLTNVGNAQLNFTSISITGTNAGDFAQTNTCGTSIAAGASCTITVKFTPTATGKRTAAVTIGDDGGGSPQKVSLTGTGTSMAVTATTLSSLPNPSVYGQAVTFTATVTSSSGAPPDGETITFKKGTTVLGTGSLSGGSASFSTSALTVGTNLVNAAYGGDSNFVASTSKAVSQVVSKAATTTTLASSLNPSNYGQAVTFTATVTPQFSGTVKAPVTFYDGTTVLKTVGPSGGVAKYTTSTLTSGSHSITATFNGGTNFLGSSASLTQKVN